MRNSVCNAWLSVALITAFAGACGHRGTEAVSAPTPKPTETLAVTDETVDLELKEAELIDALRTLGGTARINMFADSDLANAGHVTLSVHSVPWEEVLTKIASDHQLRVEKLEVRGVDRPSFWISKQSSSPAPVTTFSGERIVARFDEMPIRDAAKTLADFAKTNIVVDDGVQANITLHMRLPWDLALYHLAQKYDLRIVRSNNGFRITRR
jgi:type II secretory pathway component HofQ